MLSRRRKQNALDLRRSLQDLDGQDWGEPPFPSYLVTTCHQLRRKPLQDFTVEDLRIMIGQSIGLEFLLPLALRALADDPFVAGDYYPGDLFKYVLAVTPDYWRSRPQRQAELRAVATLAVSRLQSLEPDEAAWIGQVIDIPRLQRLVDQPDRR